MKENKLKYARIGSVLNYNTRKMEPTKHAFDLSQLAAIGRIDTANPIGVKIIESNAFANSSQDSHSFGTSNEFKLGFPKCKISIGHHMEKGEAKLETESGMSLIVGSAYVDYEIFMTKDVTEQELYDCATPRFKEKYDALVKAANFEDWLLAYEDFTKEFGHGFVSKMKLISLSAGVVSVHYESAVESTEKKYGGSVSVSVQSKGGGTSGGGASGNEWAKMHSNASAEGIVIAKSVSIPAVNSNSEWVDKFVETYTNKGIDIITTAPPASTPIPTVKPKAPEIPTIEKPKNPNALPETTLNLDSTEELVKYMQIQDMLKENKKNKKVVSWDDYQNDIKKKADALDEKTFLKDIDEDIFEEKKEEKPVRSSQQLRQMDFDSATEETNEKSFASSKAKIASTSSLSEATYSSASSPINLTDYSVYDVEYTRYRDVLSGLKFQIANPTYTAYYIAKLTLFIMTRQKFASYLHFVSDIPTEITKGYITKNRAVIYTNYLIKFTQELEGFISNTDIITKEHYEIWTNRFTDELSKESSFNLCFKVYEYFFENYEIFSSAPFGFMLYGKYKINNTEHLYYLPRSKANWDTFVADNYPAILYRWKRAQDWSTIAEKSTCFFPVIIGTETPYIHLATYVLNHSNIIVPKGQFYWRVIGSTSTYNDTLLSTDYFSDALGADQGHRGFGSATPCYLEKDQSTNDFVLKKVGDPSKKNYTFSVDIYIENDSDKTYLHTFSSLDTTHKKGTPATTYFKPIDYDMVRNQKMQGVPMWYESPFDEIKKSILWGFD